MNFPFTKKIIERIGSLFGLHPQFGTLISGGYRLTNPPSAAFPNENIPFASRVIATGMWNYCFFQFYRHFVGPYWIERQYNPEDISFLPRAGSLLSMNLTHRNWTGFRSPDSDSFALVDPAGALSPTAGQYSIEIALYENDRLRLPARRELRVVQSLLRDLPIPVTEYSSKSCSIRWTVAGSSLNGDQILSKIEYDIDPSSEASIVIGIRPFNPEGAALLHSIRCEDGSSIELNGREEIRLLTQPQKIRLSNLATGDAYFTGIDLDRVSCPDGICTAALFYPIRGRGEISLLARSGADEMAKPTVRLPGIHERGLNAIVPRIDVSLTRKLKKLYRKLPAKRGRDSLVQSGGGIPSIQDSRTDTYRMDEDLQKTADYWEERLARGAAFRCANVEWNRASKIFSGHLLTLCTGKKISPGVYTYNQFFFRDAAFLLSALTDWNFLDETRRVLQTYPSYQNGKGFFKSQEGEWDSNGQALWTIHHYASASGDMELLKRFYPCMRAGALWIRNKRAKGYQKKLLPAGFSAEHFGPADFYYWDNFWSLAGLREAARAATILHEEGDSALFQREYETYRKDIIDLSERERSLYGLIPAGPLRPADAGMIGNLCILYPLDLELFPAEQVKSTVKALHRGYFVKDLFFHPIVHSGYNIYLSLHIAQGLFRLGYVAQSRKILKRVLSKRTDHWTFPEAVHPLTGGGVMGDGFHGWAYAEVLQLLRAFLLYREGDGLHLFRGFSKKELLSESLEFGPFPMEGTTLEIEGGISKKRGRLEIRIPGIEATSIRHITLHLPSRLRDFEASCEGCSVKRAGGEIELTDLTPSIIIHLTRQITA